MHTDASTTLTHSTVIQKLKQVIRTRPWGPRNGVAVKSPVLREATSCRLERSCLSRGPASSPRYKHQISQWWRDGLRPSSSSTRWVCYDPWAVIHNNNNVTIGIRKNVEDMPRKHSVDSLQKTTILGTSHIMRKVQQPGTWSLSGGNRRWFKRSTRQKGHVTRDNNNNNNNNIVVVVVVVVVKIKIILKELYSIWANKFQTQ